jgi:DNA modification methylase
MSMKTNTVYTGEASEVLSTFEDGCIDLVVTSPPYDSLRTYQGYTFDFQAIARQLYRVIKPGGVVVWVVGDATVNGSETGTSFRQALYFMECGFNLHDTMIYQVPGTGAKGSNNCYWQVFEYMFVLSKWTPATINRLKDKKNKRAGSSTNGKNAVGTRSHKEGGTIVDDWGYRDNVWIILPGNNGDDDTNHPAPFPEALARDHILSWSNPGDIVCDPMAGSGTTLKMAKMLERQYIGIEISSEYVEKIIKPRLAATNVPLGLFSLEDA